MGNRGTVPRNELDNRKIQKNILHTCAKMKKKGHFSLFLKNYSST